MKNIVDERPTDTPNGRYQYSTRFVNSSDIKDRSILDIGCGFGWFEKFALDSGCKSISGIEISEEDLSTAKIHLKDNRLDLKVGSALEIPHQENSFDTLVSWEVIEHIPTNTEEKMFAEAARVIKPGGSFYLSTPFDSWRSKFTDPAWWLIEHRHYSQKQLESLAMKYGFKVVDMRVIGGWGFVLWSLNMYFSKWVLRRRPIFSNFVNRIVNSEFEKDNGFALIFCHFEYVGE